MRFSLQSFQSDKPSLPAMLANRVQHIIITCLHNEGDNFEMHNRLYTSIEVSSQHVVTIIGIQRASVHVSYVSSELRLLYNTP